MKMEVTKIERNGSQEREVMHSAVTAHHPLTDAQPISKQQLAPPGQIPPSSFTEHDDLWYGISLLPVQASSPGHVSSQLLKHLAEHGTLKSPS